MTALRKIVVVQACAIVALLTAAAAMAVYGALDALLRPTPLISPFAAAKLGFSYTAAFGLVPVVLYGAPGYLLLLRRGIASWPFVWLLGAAPGILLLPFHLSFGIIALLCGAVVSSVTHLQCRRLRPN